MRSHKLNSIREGVRIWVRVDERFRALERDPSVRFPAETGSVPANVLDTSGSDHREISTESKSPGLISEELIDEVADLRADVARLTARIRKLEARG
ncbi:hypothetical protein NBCG_04031 [Nocardioidaceae bacterium Broad-1]|nr:hypothetical protein NBCG_04031 [Nocardioidaceae bacterium Broad-1]